MRQPESLLCLRRRGWCVRLANKAGEGDGMAQVMRALDQFDIMGRSALVTGGASGLGLA
jgi:hypothetical protein